MDRPCVYVLANDRDGGLDIGATSNLFRLMAKHTANSGEGEANNSNEPHLVYVEFFEDMPDATQRASRIQGKPRDWQLSLIESLNPDWKNLFNAQTGELAAVLNDQIS